MKFTFLEVWELGDRAEDLWKLVQSADVRFAVPYICIIKAYADSFIKKQKIKNLIKALACNPPDFDDRQLTGDHKRVNTFKNLRQNYAILRPDKGNGVVLIKKEDYQSCLIELSSDSSKSKTLRTDSALTQISSLQNYLRTIINRGEINHEEYNDMKPTSTRSARAHSLRKIHTLTIYHHFDPLLTLLAPLINWSPNIFQDCSKPFITNKFSLQDSFDAVSQINLISPNLFNDGYRFVSLDIKSLFTNIPLKKTVNIILDRIYNQDCIVTTLKNRTLKKLLLDSCTKIPLVNSADKLTA